MGNKIGEIIKFIIFILLLPLVVTSTVGFARELSVLPERLTLWFVQGIVIYLLIHIFLYEPQPVYEFGQNLVSAIFKFFSPLVKVAPFFLPIFSFIFLILFYFVTLLFKNPTLGYVFIFLVSFTLTMHMVFTAKVLREKDTNAIKPNYFFSISLIYTINIFILALMFNLILSGFSFANYFQTATTMTGHLYQSIFKQLFVP